MQEQKYASCVGYGKDLWNVAWHFFLTFLALDREIDTVGVAPASRDSGYLAIIIHHRAKRANKAKALREDTADLVICRASDFRGSMGWLTDLFDTI